ncbi:MAG TPA: DUF5985 family protein [Xanthobacteraceae bacterium]|nr:DUF5985 family protein [Xanthobacteraceae bacterium]
MNDIFASIVYFLCFLTSAGCGWLLVRGYLRTRTKLLLWTAACFVLLALTNFFLVLDLDLLTTIDLRFLRISASLAAVATLLYGFIWELD